VQDKSELKIKAPPRCKYKYIGPRGTIIGMKYDGKRRGVFEEKNKGKKDMKNAIEIDLCISTKYVNVKLYKNNIHICGAKNFEMIHDTFNVLNEHFVRIQEQLAYSRVNYEILNTMILHAKGQAFIKGKKERHELIIPEEIDDNLTIYCSNLNSISNWETFEQYCNWVRRIKTIQTGIFSIDSIFTSNVNYNYKLNFEIDRKKMRDEIKKIAGFTSRYDGKQSRNVRVELEINPKELEGRPFKKKNVKPKHTYIISGSGSIMQCSPDLNTGSKGFIKFMNAVGSISGSIAVKN
jgi:phage anti-repressor protein